MSVKSARDLSSRQLDQVARLADEIDVRAGKRLATAGETGHELFVIIEGTAAVKAGRGRAMRLGRGEFFGEMSLVDGGSRSATVEAATDMRLLVVGRRELAIAERSPAPGPEDHEHVVTPGSRRRIIGFGMTRLESIARG